MRTSTPIPTQRRGKSTAAAAASSKSSAARARHYLASDAKCILHIIYNICLFCRSTQIANWKTQHRHLDIGYQEICVIRSKVQGMLRKWTCGAILGGLLLVCSLNLQLVAQVGAEEELGDNPETVLDRGIELSELAYEDHCKPAAEAEWTLLHKVDSPDALDQWEEALIDLANFKKKERSSIKQEFQDITKESPLGYKLSVIQAPGDALLDAPDYEKLVKFYGRNRVLRATGRYLDGTKNLTQQEVEYLLSHNGKAEDKLKAWTAWHQCFSSQVDEFPSVLQLVQKAAKANDQASAQSYWEMLIGERNAYDSIGYQLDRLTELRQKLFSFARKRLAKKYSDVTMKNDSVPAHLLGSLAGNDWTNLAFDLAPEPEVIFELRKNLWEKRMMGKWLYKTASSLGKRFLGQPVSPSHQVESDFWSKSDFKAACPSSLISFCELEKIRVSTCSEPSISNYLAAHKDVAKVLLHQMSAKFPILNDVNRYSVLEEAVAELFSILATSPAWLQNVGLMNESVGSQEAEITSLAITALDVLPRLAYYYSVDKWRLEAVENNLTDPKNLTSSWWDNRMKNEYTYSEDGEPPTFLNDDYVISNKPYLSKVLGIVLAFQMYEYIMGSTAVRHKPFDKSSFNSNFVRTVQNNSENWKTVIDKFMEIDSISTKSMSDYFGELEYYFDSYEEPENAKKSYDYATKEAELEQLEKRYRKIANTPAVTTTSKPVLSKSKAPPKSQTKDATTVKSSDSVAGHHQPDVQQQPPAVKKAKQPAEKDSSFLEDNEALLEDEEVKTPKVSKSKAVWAVGTVLVATVTICIIAIFGRRRCSRTPKNRRYV